MLDDPYGVGPWIEIVRQVAIEVEIAQSTRKAGNDVREKPFRPLGEGETDLRRSRDAVGQLASHGRSLRMSAEVRESPQNSGN